jgi:hypothetical protein
MSSIKFIGGVILGTVEKLSIIEIAFFTFLGSMTTVVLISFLGNKYRNQATYLFKKLKFQFFKIKILLLHNNASSFEKRQRLNEFALRQFTSKKMTKISRLAVKTWRKFGLSGIALLTPLILSPLGGTLIAVSFKVNTKKIIVYMAVAHLVMALFFAYVFVEFKLFIQEWVGIKLHENH